MAALTDVLYNRATAVWLVLVSAMLVSWGVGDGILLRDRRSAGVAVLLIAFVKVSFVMMDFMEIRRAPLLMRVVSGGWIVIVGTVLVTIYWLGTEPAMQAVWPHINGL